MSDHYHYDYAEARHDHRGDYAADRHDHDIDYAEKHHRHYDGERALEELRGQVRELRAIMIEFGLELSEAQGRIHLLEQDTPQARQLQLEADQAAAGVAEYGDEDQDAADVDDELQPVVCLRAIPTDKGQRACLLPVDHEPAGECPGNPHARPAPEASQP